MATQTTSTSTELSTQTQAAPPAVAGAHAAPVAAPRWTPEQVQAANFENGGAVMALDKAETIPLPLSTEYWSPETIGESIRCYVAGIQNTEIVDPQTGEIKYMDAVYLLEVTEEGKVRKWMNAGKVLVGNISDAIRRGQIIPNTGLTPIKITYTGQIKNRSNSRLSKRFEILPLVVGGAA